MMRPGVFWLSVMVLVSGCNQYGGRQEISGTVKLKGEPLDQGIITFSPIGPADEAEAVTKSGAAIASGAYRINQEDGLVPGKYLVTITSGDGKTPANPDEPPGPTGNIVSKERIPAEYNVSSRQEVEVSADKPNVFNYDIP